MGDTIYLVFRDYTRKERPNRDERTIFYGWTDNKSVLKAFLGQRDRSKYVVRKAKYDDESSEYGHYVINGMPVRVYDDDEENVRINYLELTSSQSGEKFSLFMTRNEMYQAEVDIQKMFHEKSSLRYVKGDGNYAEMILNLEQKYYESLRAIGYRPPDLDYLFPTGEDYTEINEVVSQIDDAYLSATAVDAYNEYGSHSKPPGSWFMNDLYTKVIYSIESFIMVLRDNL